MSLPRIEIYLNDDGGLSIANVKAGSRGPLVIDIAKGEFGPSESDAVRQLGTVILGTLKLWHPAQMADLLGGTEEGEKHL